MPVSGPPWDDNPAAFLCGLESTAEGCRWLLERWSVLGDMLEREAIWTLTDLYRSIRLQGKHPVDAVNDPDLNLQIQAWEMMSPGAAVDFWERCYHQTPKVDPGFQGFMEWREIADKPADEAEAMVLIKRMIAGRIERLEELIALYNRRSRGEEAIELADAASFDPGPEAETVAEVPGGEVARTEADARAVPEDAGGEGEAEHLHHGGRRGYGGRRRRNQECGERSQFREGQTEDLHHGRHGRHEGRERRNQELPRTKPIPGAGQGGVGRGRERWRPGPI